MVLKTTAAAQAASQRRTAQPVHAPAAAAPLAVVHAVLSLDVGGLERVVLDLVSEGRRLGQDVSVLCLERPGTLAPRVEELGARVACARKPPGKRWGVGGLVLPILGEMKPTVLHTHQVGALLYAGPAARRAGVPVVVHTEHNNHIRKQAGSLRGRLRTKFLCRLAGRHSDRFFCVSGDVASAVREHRLYPPDRTFVVPNGIDLGRFEATGDPAALRQSLGIPQSAPVVGTVGRLNEVKRQDVLLRAFARARRHAPAAHLIVVGDGPMMADLRRLAADLGVAHAVRFVGYQLEPAAYLAAMDVFALTSRIEGMPLAVLEAWAAALPVVASRVGGIPEVVGDGASGMLFDFGDDKALDEALRSLLGDPTLRRRLGQAGRERVEAAYSLTHMALEYQRHYQELLAPRSRNKATAGIVP